MKSAQDLTKIANELRVEVLKMIHLAGAGHVAGSLSSAELVTALYLADGMQHDPGNPWDEERDRVILSCGHYVPIQYAVFAKMEYFEKSLLDKYMQIDGLPGHPERRSHPGIEATTGSLGQGVSQAVGMAMALKLKYGERPRRQTPRVWCVLSDGELQEGQVWEAFNTAVRRQLDNLVFILDRNHVQIENYVSQVATYGHVAGRLEAFGLYVLETDGNEMGEVMERLKQAKEVQGGPVIIVSHTVAGKGVSYMEGKPEWHDKVPNKQELEKALAELRIKN